MPPAVTQDQLSPPLDSLDIALWPEFDRMSMLVIYQANLSPDTQFPVSVRLPIPAGVQPNAVAQGNADGQLVDVDYSLEEQGGHTVVTLQATSQLVWLEFYQDLDLNGSQRTFEFKWPGGLAVPSLLLQVQDPPGISNLTLRPASTDEVVGQYGLTYKQVNLGAVSPSDQPTLQVSYTKIGTGLTVDTLQQTPQPIPTQAAVANGPEPSQVVTWVVIGLLGVMVAVVGVLYFKVWRFPPKNRSPRRRHRSRSNASDASRSPTSSKPAGDSPGVFCHECGTQADPQDRFCRSCGTRLRR